MAKAFIHVNQHVIRSNRKHGTSEPVLTIKTYSSNVKANDAIVVCPDCAALAAHIKYRPDAPLDCGAQVWIEVNERDCVKTKRNKKLIKNA